MSKNEGRPTVDNVVSITTATGRKVTKPEEFKKALTAAEVEALLKSEGIPIDGLPLTNVGHARRMFKAVDGRVRFVTKEGGGDWIVYDAGTGTWTRHAAPQIVGEEVTKIGPLLTSWIDTLMEKLGALAKNTTKSAETKAKEEMTLLGLMEVLHDARGKFDNAVNTIIGHASRISAHHIRPDVFDADPWKLAVANGVIDLHTGTKLDHSPENYITRRLKIDYVPGAPCPTWLTFMENMIPEDDVREYVQKFLGYCLTGDVQEQLALILLGKTKTGKSTMLKAVARILGSLAHSAQRGLFRKRLDNRFATGGIIGKRLTVDGEYEKNDEFAYGTFLQLTGEPEHSADIKMHELRQDVPITTKFAMSMNRFIHFDASNQEVVDAVMRRCLVVRMDVPLISKYTVAEIVELSDTFWSESEGILAWLVEGELMRRGTALLGSEPAQILAWREKCKADLLGAPAPVDPFEVALRQSGYGWPVPAGEAFAQDILTAVNGHLLRPMNNTSLSLALKKLPGVTKGAPTKRRPGAPTDTPKLAWYEGVALAGGASGASGATSPQPAATSNGDDADQSDHQAKSDHETDHEAVETDEAVGEVTPPAPPTPPADQVTS